MEKDTWIFPGGEDVRPAQYWNNSQIRLPSLVSSDETYTILLTTEQVLGNVVSTLQSELSTSQYGLVCRIFDSSDFSFTMEAGERYGILKILDQGPFPDSGKVVIPVYMDGLVPLCDHIQLDKETYLIFLTTDATTFGSNVHIPFRREENKAQSYKIEYEPFFIITNDGTCQPGLTMTPPASSQDLGCIAHGSGTSDPTAVWVAKQDSSVLADKVTAQVGTSPDWAIHRFTALSTSSVTIAPKVVNLSTTALETIIPANQVSAFIGQSASVMEVECGRADSLQVIDANDKVIATVTRGSSTQNFQLDLYRVTKQDLRVRALGSDADGRKSYCQYSRQISGSRNAPLLVTNGDPDGVHQVAEPGKPVDNTKKLLSGVTVQIVHESFTSDFYKTWEGVLSITSAPDRSVLRIEITKEHEDMMISATLGGIELPFDAGLYYNDPYGFLQKLKLVLEPAEKFDGGVRMNTDGSLTVRKSRITQEFIDRIGSLQGAAEAFGISEDRIESVKVDGYPVDPSDSVEPATDSEGPTSAKHPPSVETPTSAKEPTASRKPTASRRPTATKKPTGGGGGDKNSGGSLPIGAIVGGVCGGIAVIVGIGMLLYLRRRKKAKAPLESSLSSCCQAGLDPVALSLLH
jgi:hypothetical protein